MWWEVVRRGVAIGVVFGAAAAAETLRITPALRDAASLRPALELAALFVAGYAGIGVAVGLAAAGLATLGPRVGVRTLAQLGSARALWPLAFLGLAFVAVNESARSVDELDRHRHVARAAIVVLAGAALARACARPAPPGPRVGVLEPALALGIAPALVGVALYFSRPVPREPSEGMTEGVLALAPQFEAESAAALAPVRQAGRPRVLVIGVDGASWDRIERGIAAGRLPTLAKLRESGISAPLHSLEPTYSPLVWTSMMTGVTPPEHGIEDFYLMQLPRLGVQNLHIRRSFGVVRDALSRTGELRFVPVTSSLRRRKAIWNLADEAGLATAVIGLWATWPPEPLRHGVVVSDHASGARQREWMDRGKSSQRSAGTTTWPREWQERLAPLQRTPDSVDRDELAAFVDVDDATWAEFEATRQFSKGAPLSAFRSSHLNDAFYAAAAESIWQTQRPDLLILYLRAVDELSHFFYEAGVPEARALGWSDRDIARFGDVVDNAYAWTDATIAPLVDAALSEGQTLVAVVSDHGWEREASGGYDHNDAPPGILVLAGAGVCRDACPPLDAPSIYDVAPTLLARLGLPLSDELAGRPLDEAFATHRPVVHVAAYGRPRNEPRALASESDGVMRQKLEALGYLRR